MSRVLISIFLLFCGVCSYAQKADTFQVYFSTNEPKLSKQSITYLDNLIFNDKLIHGQKLIVLGYTDYVGDNAYNESLSAKRAKNVQDYLVTSGGLEQKDIKLCIGKGKIDRTNTSGKEGYEKDRKVQIIVDKEFHTPPRPIVKTAAPKPAPKPAPTKEVEFIPVAAIKTDTTFRLNILFENNSHVVLEESEPELRRLYDFMEQNKTVHIQIEGHICCMPPDKHNDGPDVNGGAPVSWSRAKAVYDYLLENGIEKSRLKYIGLGSYGMLVYPEKSTEDQIKNRRVEIRILSK